jgi:gluconate 2-dehydrogenase gamma chain
MKQDRRVFLKTLGAASMAGAAPAGVAAASPPTAVAPSTDAPERPTAEPAETYVYLSPAEVAFLDAALARLIPADELGPGAKEAGVAVFIDRQLAGAFGTMAREYRQGPWSEGTPQQGYQSRLTPQEVYRTAIAEIDRRCEAAHGERFAGLPAAKQDDVLRSLEDGSFALDSGPARLFFALLWQNTKEGFFADPIHGGNRGKVGWKLVGFPGVAAAYTDHVERHGVPYRVEPVSIADLQQGRARTDAHGHPLHHPARGRAE